MISYILCILDTTISGNNRVDKLQYHADVREATLGWIVNHIEVFIVFVAVLTQGLHFKHLPLLNVIF